MIIIMSSSSSLSAARRRRAGGATNTNPAPSNNRPNQPPQNQQPPKNQQPPNPFMLLQQHHIKIGELDSKVNKLMSNDISQPQISHTIPSNGMSPSIDEISNTVITHIESQLDLKAFYENDSRLASEIEELNKVVNNQQLVINGLNTTLFHIIQQLNIKPPPPMLFSVANDTKLHPEYQIDLSQNVSFNINDMTHGNELTGMGDDDDKLFNYEGGSVKNMTDLSSSNLNLSSN